MSEPQVQPPSLGFGQGVQNNLPVGPSAFQRSEERLKREDAATGGDYVRSIWRQDGLADGLVANLAGRELMPDPSYSVFEDKEWKDLTNGLQDEFIPELYQAHSPAHARYIKDLLMQKQEDLLRLGDLGWKGNVGRFALNAIMPDQLLMAMSGGWVARGVRMAQLAQGMARGGSSVVGAATERAAVAAEQAVARSSGKAVAVGVGVGAAENAAYEKMRQSVNFESDTQQVLEAALIGAAFTTPFALAGARAERRIAQVAKKEHEVLTVLRAVDEGTPLTPEQGRMLKEVADRHEVITSIESGRLTTDEAIAKLNEFQGPQEPDAMWLNRLGDSLEERGRQMLDELFPNRVTERTRQQFNPDGTPLRLGYDKTAGRRRLVVDRRGNALPSLDLVEIDKSLANTAAKRFPKNAEARERWMMEQRAALLGLHEKALARAAAATDTAPTPKALIGKDEAPKATPPDAGVAAMRELVEETNTGTKAPEVETPKEAPEAPAKAPELDWTGEHVSWAHARTGEPMEGTVRGRNKAGMLEVEDDMGKVHIVHESRFNEADAEVPSGFLPNSIGAAQVAPLSSVATQRSALNVTGKGGVPLRWDLFAMLNRSKSEEVRKLAFSLIKDPIQVDKFEAQRMTASEWKSHYKRTFVGPLHRSAGEAADEAAKVSQVPRWRVGEFKDQFYSDVTRLTRGDQSVLQANPNIAPMLQKASKAQREFYKNMIEEAKKAGVKGADEIDVNDFYVNRIWNHTGIRDAISKHGTDAVVDLLAKAINVPGHIGDRAKAAKFLSSVQKLEFAPAMQNIALHAQDMGTLRDGLKQAAPTMTPQEIDDFIAMMFQAKEASGTDAGRTGRLKYRFDINETLSANTQAGVLRIADLFENNMKTLADSYSSSMSGHIGLAKQGIDSQATFMARMQRIAQEGVDKQLDGKQLASEVKWLQDIYNNISGKPMSTQDFSVSNRVAGVIRAYTRAAMLGQLGVAAAFEMKQAIGLMGFRAFWQHSPSFRQIISSVRKGYIPDAQLARDLEHISGFGFEKAAAYARAQEIEDGFLGQTLSRAERGANKMSHAVDVLSGNASFTSLTRQLSAMMSAQRMHDFATGRMKLTPKLRERMVGHGLDDVEIDGMLQHLKDYSEAKGNKLDTIDYERWKMEEPDTYEMFQTVNSRMVRDAIQDHDLGETMPFMHSTLGKVFAELRNFFLVAYGKNFLKQMHFRDATAFQVWTLGFIGEAMAYSAQAGANYAHDPDKMAEMLTPYNISMAALMRSPTLGMAGFAIDSGYSLMTGGDSLVQPGMTTNTDNRTLWNSPSLTLIKRMGSLPQTLGGALLGTDVTTKQEFRDAWSVLPGNNLYGLRNLGNYLANTMPASDPEKGR
jgi:hypothetical protein